LLNMPNRVKKGKCLRALSLMVIIADTGKIFARCLVDKAAARDWYVPLEVVAGVDELLRGISPGLDFLGSN